MNERLKRNSMRMKVTKNASWKWDFAELTSCSSTYSQVVVLTHLKKDKSNWIISPNSIIFLRPPAPIASMYGNFM